MIPILYFLLHLQCLNILQPIYFVYRSNRINRIVTANLIKLFHEYRRNTKNTMMRILLSILATYDTSYRITYRLKPIFCNSIYVQILGERYVSGNYILPKCHIISHLPLLPVTPRYHGSLKHVVATLAHNLSEGSTPTGNAALN